MNKEEPSFTIQLPPEPERRELLEELEREYPDLRRDRLRWTAAELRERETLEKLRLKRRAKDKAQRKARKRNRRH